MDVTMMPFVAEAAPPTPTPKAPGKAASGKKEDGDGFAAMFAGMTEAAPDGEGTKETAEADASTGEGPGTQPGIMPGMVPGLWSFVPLMPTAMNAGQAQTATEGTGAIAPLTAAGMQVATRPDAAGGQSLPGAPSAPLVTADAGLVPQLPLQVQQPQTLPQTQQQSQLQPGAPVVTTQTAAPAVQTEGTPALAAFPVTQAATAAPQQAAAPAAQATVTVPAAEAEAVAAQQTSAPQVTVALPAAAPTVAMTAVAKPPAAAGDQRKANGPTAETGTADQAVAQAPTVPTISAPPETAGSDGDTAPADYSLADDAPATAKADAPVTTTAPAFAAMIDQRLAPAAADAAQPATDDRQPAGVDPYNVAGQIVDHARLITRADNSEMVIKLKPEHLGELTLKIAVENGTVSATFHTSSAEVRSAIEASLPQLRQDMAGQGLKVDYVGVYASLDHFFANDQRHAPQQQQLPTTRRTGDDEVFAAEAVTAAAPQSTATATGGIDYRI